MTGAIDGRAALLHHLRSGASFRTRPDADRDMRAGCYPLTPIQRGITIAHEMSAAPIYNCPLAIRLTGRLDVDALRRAMTLLIDRHSVLRLTIRLEQGAGGIQQVAERAEAPFHVVDLAHGPHAEVAQRITACIEQEARRPFDLVTGPLWRLTLGRISPEDHVAVIVVHHVVSDGWSLNILVTELVEAYNAALVRNTKPAWRPIGQFVDLAAETARAAVEGSAAAQLSKAVSEFADITRLELPADRPLPATPATHGTTCQLPIDASLGATVEAFARRLRVTRFAIVMSALQIVLSAHAGQRSFALATIVSGRNDPRWTRTVGPLLNVVLISCNVDPDASVAHHIERVAQRLAAAQEPTAPPYETLVRHLDPGVPTHQAPLAPVLFQMPPPVADGVPGMVGLQVTPIPLTDESTRFELSVQLHDDPAGLRLALTHDGQVRTPERVLHLGKAILATLHKFTDGTPQATLASLGAGPIHVPQGAPLAAPPAPHAAGNTVLGTSAVDAEGDLTDVQVVSLADRVAARLIELGVRDNDIVGVECGMDRTVLPAVLSALRAGATYCLVDPADAVDVRGRPTLIAVPRLAAVLTTSAGASVLTRTDGGHVPAVPMPAIDRTAAASSGWRGWLTEIARAFSERAMCLPLVRGDGGRLEPGVPVLWSQTTHVGGLLATETRTAGAVPVVSTTAQHLFIPALLTVVASGARWLEFCGRHEVMPRLSQQPPPAVIFADLHLLAELERGIEDGVLGPIQPIVVFGPRLSTATAAAWARRRAHMRYGYVPTRCGLPATLGPIRQDHTTATWVETDSLIWDATLAPTAGVVHIAGAPAELVVGGIPTGDRVLLTPNGKLQPVSREGRQAVNGRRFADLDTVEAVLLELPTVTAAAAFVNDDGRLEASVVLRRQTNPEVLLAELQGRVAAHLVPERLHVTDIRTTGDGFPLPARPAGEVHGGGSPVPVTVIEQQVIDLFAEILGRGAADLSPTTDFFDQGGHSLAAVRLVELIRRRMRAPIQVRDLYAARTPASIARLVGARPRDVAAPAHAPVTMRGTGTVELVFIHPIGGELLCYQTLVESLGARHVLGLPAAGSQLEETGPRLTRLGRAHARALLDAGIGHPAPVLAGWSAGGIFALATAEALAADGVAVPAVVLLDSRPVDPDRRRRLLAQVTNLLHLRGLAERGQVSEVVQTLAPVLPPFGLASDELYGIGAAELARLIEVWGAAIEAMCEFSTTSYRGRTVLIPGSGDPRLPCNDAALWAEAVPGLDVAPPVAADHFALLRPPAVDRVSELLGAVIDRKPLIRAGGPA